jgi:hypothetical protein
LVVLERFVLRISTLGLGNDVKFEPLVKRILEGLDSASTQFEQAQVELGRLIGYDSAKLTVEAAPDPYWRVDDSLVIVFEDHSDGDTGGTLSVLKARQAAAHERTIRKHLNLADNADVYTVLVTPAARAAEEALQHLEDVYFLSKADYNAWAHHALETVRAIRATMGGNAGFEERTRTLESMLRAKLLPETLVTFLTSKRAATALAGPGVA